MRVLLITGMICCGVCLLTPLALKWDAMAGHECRCGGCGDGICRVDLCTCSVHCSCMSCCHTADTRDGHEHSHSPSRLATQPDGGLDLR